MHIVYNIVTGILGGAIAVASTPGEGTIVTVTLPLVAPQAAAGTAAGTLDAPDHAPGTRATALGQPFPDAPPPTTREPG
jgi:hypothetical protein